ncbi:MAG: chemotaxis protein CheB [Myxococcota bacterium]
MKPPPRILIVDDSSVCRALLREQLETEGDVQVVGEAADGATALRRVHAERPDLVTVDLHMPGMDGLTLIERIMSEAPTPILVVTGEPEGSNAEGVFEAQRRGALDLARKPADDDAHAAADLRASVRRLAGVRVVRHMRRRAPSPVPPPPTAGPAPPARPTDAGDPRIRVVGIAASAGGPAALVSVLGRLPRPFPVPVAVVQHLPRGFAASFAEFLRRRTGLRVRAVNDALQPTPGDVLVAGDDVHLVVSPRGGFAVDRGGPVDGHRPSATVLLRSLAATFGPRAMGVVLSGMGQDGVDGLGAIRDAGGVTVAQDRETSAVFGMPRAAAEQGVAQRVLALDAIGPAIAGAVLGREGPGNDRGAA